MPRIDERQEDDFFRSVSESDNFSSGEEDVPPPDLREVKKKSRSKEESLREKPPLPSKHAAPPIVSAPVDSAPVAQENDVDEDGFVALKAENLFDISEGEEDDEDKSDDSESDGEKLDSKQRKKRRDEEEENSSESEEEEEEKDMEGEKKGSRRGPEHFKVVTTAVSSFLRPGDKAKKKKPARQESGPEPKDNEEEEGIGKEKTEENNEKEDEEDEEKEEEEEENEAKPSKEKEEEEEEPRVEFTGETKPEVKFNQLIIIGRQSIVHTKIMNFRMGKLMLDCYNALAETGTRVNEYLQT